LIFAMVFEKTTIKIPSVTKGWNLDTRCYLPSGIEAGKPVPVIVMAHGFGANKLMGLAKYADAFASIGYACLVFDYRRWGASDGVPRHILIVKDQLEDYRTVIRYAREQPQFDSERVVVWGSSFSGGHSITLAAEPTVNVFAAIAQCPYTGSTAPIKVTTSFLKTIFYASTDVIKQTLGMKPSYIPGVAEPGKVGGLTEDGSLEGLYAICDNKEDFPNEISASSLLQIPSYQPVATASAIKCPLLLIAPTQDNLCLLPSAEKVVELAPKGEILKLDTGHFDVYPGQSHWEASIESMLVFLKVNVPV